MIEVKVCRRQQKYRHDCNKSHYFNFSNKTPRKFSGEHIVVGLSVRPSVRANIQWSMSFIPSIILVKKKKEIPLTDWFMSLFYWFMGKNATERSKKKHINPICWHIRLSVRTSRIRVRPITLLFEVGFYIYFTEIITILRRVASNIWVATLKVKVTAWP
jgi:hypothetical protein